MVETAEDVRDTSERLERFTAGERERNPGDRGSWVDAPGDTLGDVDLQGARDGVGVSRTNVPVAVRVVEFLRIDDDEFSHAQKGKLVDDVRSEASDSDNPYPRGF